MYLYLYLYLYLYIYIYIYMYLFIHLFIYLFISLFNIDPFKGPYKPKTHIWVFRKNGLRGESS